MEISEVRQRVLQAIAHAKRGAAERRTRTDEASREYEIFLDRIAVPLFRQVANALKAEGYPFSVFTPSGSVSLVSERTSEDFIELRLDTEGEQPVVVGRTSRVRGRRVTELLRPLADVPVRAITEDQVLRFLLDELERLVER